MLNAAKYTTYTYKLYRVFYNKQQNSSQHFCAFTFYVSGACYTYCCCYYCCCRCGCCVHVLCVSVSVYVTFICPAVVQHAPCSPWLVLVVVLMLLVLPVLNNLAPFYCWLRRMLTIFGGNHASPLGCSATF